MRKKPELLINPPLHFIHNFRLRKSRYLSHRYLGFEAGIGWRMSDEVGKVTRKKIILKPGFFS